MVDTPTKLRLAALLLASTALGFAAQAADLEFFQPLKPPRGVQVVAHAGRPALAPPNSPQALQLCIDDELEWIEIDVRRTADGQHVLFHDATLDRTSSGQGPIAGKTLDELNQLDFGAWYGNRFKGTKLLTLEHCLKLCKQRINLLLDCKQVDTASLVAQITGADMQRQVLVFGSRELLAQVREKSNGAIALAAKWTASEDLDSLLSLRPTVVEINASDVTPELCRRLHDRGVKVLANMLGEADQPADWDRVLAAGADLLQSDVPEELIAHRTSNKLATRSARVTCHRGASRYAPENTLPAFEKAYRLRADLVEFDVRPARDGVYFLLHDGQLDRTTNGRGPIRELSSAAIEMLDAGAWFSNRFRGEHVPRLEAFLAAVPSGVELYFDAKDIPPSELAEALARHQLVERTVVYQSAEYLARLKQIDARIRRMPPAASTADIDRVKVEVQPFAVDTRWNALSRQYIDHCHAAGIQVFADAPFIVSVNGYVRAIEWGIDAIQTDHPLRFWRAIELAPVARTKP